MRLAPANGNDVGTWWHYALSWGNMLAITWHPLVGIYQLLTLALPT
jgi:hypothetical protein